jgi:hypothetical protein
VLKCLPRKRRDVVARTMQCFGRKQSRSCSSVSTDKVLKREENTEVKIEIEVSDPVGAPFAFRDCAPDLFKRWSELYQSVIEELRKNLRNRRARQLHYRDPVFAKPFLARCTGIQDTLNI